MKAIVTSALNKLRRADLLEHRAGSSPFAARDILILVVERRPIQRGVMVRAPAGRDHAPVSASR